MARPGQSVIGAELLIHNEPTKIISGGFYQHCWPTLGRRCRALGDLLATALGSSILSRTKSSREERVLIASPESLDPAMPGVYVGSFSFMGQ